MAGEIGKKVGGSSLDASTGVIAGPISTLLTISIITVVTSIGALITVGSAINSTIPERYWGSKTPSILKYLFFGILGWFFSLGLICFWPLLSQKTKYLIDFLGLESLPGGTLAAYTFVASALSFGIGAIIFIANGIVKDRMARRGNRKRLAIMELIQRRIDGVNQQNESRSGK